MGTTILGTALMNERHADLLRTAAERRRAPRRERRRPRVAIRGGGRYFAHGRPSQRGELHRAGA